MLQQAQIAGGLSGNQVTGTISQDNLSPTQTVGAGLLNSGVNQIGNAINDFDFGSLFSGGGSDFGAGFGQGSIFSTPGGAR